ncbi:MAG: PH domain-containing protein [Alphaproteobacteria bacterium]|nr:PH domain-containing protein [Alphaproteobacteria bacterium]
MKNLKQAMRRNQENAVEERLVSGEIVLERAVIHPGIYWQSIAVLILAMFFGLFIAVELGIMLAFVALLMAFYAGLVQSILVLVMTNKRVLTRYGLLQVDVVDIHFDKIESIELERMLPGYLMGYANVLISGTGNRLIRIPYVANGPALRRAYNEQVLGNKG